MNARPRIAFHLLLATLLLSVFAPTAQAYYSPSSGRWLTRDPMGTPLASPEFTPSVSMRIGGGAASVQLDPSWQYWDGMNLYQYVGSMPALRADPAGLGPVEWILTGEWDPDPDVLNAAQCGYLEGLGMNPFNTKQSLGQFLYTGALDASPAVLSGACGAAPSGADCFVDCMSDVHKQLLAALGGGVGAATGLPVPKEYFARLAQIMRMSGLASEIRTTAALGGQTSNVYRFGQSVCQNAIRGGASSRLLMWAQGNHGLGGIAKGLGRTGILGRLATVAKLSLGGAAVAETILSVYCTEQCGGIDALVDIVTP